MKAKKVIANIFIILHDLVEIIRFENYNLDDRKMIEKGI